MEILNFILAVTALVVAVLAFQRTGGIHDLRRQMEDLSEKSEHATKSARDLTADALGRLESFIRGQGKPPSPDREEPKEPREEPQNPPSTPENK